jgi:hypothetical protein
MKYEYVEDEREVSHWGLRVLSCPDKLVVRGRSSDLWRFRVPLSETLD